jgi:zinc protease
MNNAFGQYAIGGRLGDSIRERQGMAYYVSSSLDANVVEGPLAIRAGVSPANVDRASRRSTRRSRAWSATG